MRVITSIFFHDDEFSTLVIDSDSILSNIALVVYNTDDCSYENLVLCDSINCRDIIGYHLIDDKFKLFAYKKEFVDLLVYIKVINTEYYSDYEEFYDEEFDAIQYESFVYDEDRFDDNLYLVDTYFHRDELTLLVLSSIYDEMSNICNEDFVVMMVNNNSFLDDDCLVITFFVNDLDIFSKKLLKYSLLLSARS